MKNKCKCKVPIMDSDDSSICGKCGYKLSKKQLSIMPEQDSVYNFLDKKGITHWMFVDILDCNFKPYRIADLIAEYHIKKTNGKI